MADGKEIKIKKIEIARDLTVAYMNSIYPKPLSALSDEARQKTAQQNSKDVADFMKAVYKALDEILPDEE
ncbi:hypothetical protein GF312_02895 [Candidatus Poribacteria bacterium]|nr:hypothetical protein [Candidatus Poribacteria bacterium]